MSPATWTATQVVLHTERGCQPSSDSQACGEDITALQRMLGHEWASITLDVHADLFDDDLDAIADRLAAAKKK